MQQSLPKILLVDDRSSNLLALKDLLEDVGAELLLAYSGNEALGVLAQQEVALVLLDVQMPEMDGIEVATLMRQLEVTKHIPIIFVTAYGQNEEMTFKGYEAGAVDYLQKPIDSKILRSKVTVFLDLDRQRHELERIISELGLSQSALQKVSHELRRSNDELKDFAFIASHQLQEPLRKIHIFGDSLKRDSYDQLSEKGRKHLERIQQSSLRMRELIQNILSLSKIQSQRNPMEPVNLNDLVSDVVNSVLMHVDGEQNQIDVGDLPIIEADPIQMVQVFQNLIGNAIKYKHSDRPLAVSVTASQASDGFSQITIEDNGIGFSSEYHEQIFQMFKRLHGTTTYDGTGIGLTLCRKIVERHGGTISATGRDGDGATFVLRLPIHQASTVSALL